MDAENHIQDHNSVEENKKRVSRRVQSSIECEEFQGGGRGEGGCDMLKVEWFRLLTGRRFNVTIQ